MPRKMIKGTKGPAKRKMIIKVKKLPGGRTPRENTLPETLRVWVKGKGSSKKKA